ncbi:MAG: aquaporin [Coriobacteriia bacterium]|nr:aquaporin [Coriobacteriia bacterium]
MFDNDIKKYMAEFMGTAGLIFLGCGCAVLVGGENLGAGNPGGNVVVALAFGLSVVAMAYTLGKVSGCHLNPAISLALLIDKRLPVRRFFGYVGAQVLGATTGAGVLFLVVTLAGIDPGNLASNSAAGAGGPVGAIIVEVILTSIFVFVILGVITDPDKGNIAGLIAGLSLTLVIIVGISFTGASFNPARSIGPAIFGGAEALSELWIFILAPLAGGALAILAFKVFKEKVKAPPKQK